MEQEKYEIVKFVDNGFELEVNVSPSEDTVWLTQQQLALLFNTTKQNIGLQIKNILNEKELDIRTVKDFFTVQMEGSRVVNRIVKVYNTVRAWKCTITEPQLFPFRKKFKFCCTFFLRFQMESTVFLL